MSKEIRSQLIDLYLSVKVRKSDDINNITNEIINKERDSLKKLPLTDIINYIQNSIDTLVEIRANEKYEEKIEKDEENKNYINKEDPNDINGLKLYEGMLINAEKNIRSHIRVSYNFIYNIFQNEQELKLIIDELEAQLDDINNGHISNKKIKNDNLFNFHPINTGLMNHLKKENEKLRKLVISYELKNKKNIYKLNNNKNKENINNDFIISKFNFNIIKKNNNSNNNSYNKENKYNLTRITKKPEIRKIKDINLFDNDYTYLKRKGKEKEKEKEDLLYQKYTNTIYNNNTHNTNYNNYTNNTAIKEKTNALSQRNRRLINMGGNNNSINSNTMRVKNVIINKNINNYILKPYKNLSSNRSHSKIIKGRKIYENNFNNNSLKYEKKPNYIMKSIENRKKMNSSLDKNNIYNNNNSNSRQRHTQYIKKDKDNKKDNVKEIYYQKPIINKITIYNNINNSYNNSNMNQHLQLSEKTGKYIIRRKQGKKLCNLYK